MKRSNSPLHLYSLAQKLYPRPFHADYSKQQLQIVQDMLDSADTRRERLTIWMKVWTDLGPSILAEQVNYQGSIIMNDTPKYLKTVSFITATLLVPFMFILIVNATDRLVYHSNLYGSWLWQAPFLRLWVLLLPEVALLLAIATIAIYVARGKNNPNWIKRLFDLRRTWPIVIPGLVALGILLVVTFHDSFQCVRLITDPGQAVHCAINNQSIKIFHKFF